MRTVRPTIRGDVLFDGDVVITVGSAGWFRWLNNASTFAYETPQGRFTARKERAGSQRGGAYWRAYRRVAGRLIHVYLGKDDALAYDRLLSAAAQLQLEIPHTNEYEPALNLRQPQHEPNRTPSASSRFDALLVQSPLLESKLTPPSLRSGLVVRPQVTARLEHALEHPVTLVIAPAGYGKTTALAALSAQLSAQSAEAGFAGAIQNAKLRTQNVSVAWLALDASDDEPARFWVHAIAALRRVAPRCGATALALLQQSMTHLDAVLAALLADFTALPPAVLVLDDYHAIGAPDIHTSLAQLVDRLPGQVRLILGTRSEPPLPLARWRVQGVMAEVHADDLRFTAREAEALLSATHLPNDDVATLYARTEGWAAALQLAVLALRDHAQPANVARTFDGSSRYLAEYLLAEVFSRQPADVQSFLLRTALLDRMSAGLCDALFEQPIGSSAMLDSLERSGLFVTRHDPAGQWFSYHQLFREFLLQRARQDTSDHTEFHRRAARWLEQTGMFDTAATHALAANDMEWAARLVAAQVPALLRRGEFATLRRWLECLPNATVWSHPRLCLAQIWSWIDVHQLGSTGPYFERINKLLASADAADPLLRTEALAVRAIVAAMRDRPEQALALARQAGNHSHDLDQFAQMYVAFSLGAGFKMSLRFELAAPYFQRAGNLALEAGDTYMAFISFGNLADIEYEQGRLFESDRSNQRALASAQIAPSVEQPSAGGIHWALARTAFARNDLDRAMFHAERCMSLCAVWGNDSMWLRGRIVHIRVLLARGDIDAAEASLREAENYAHRAGDPKVPQAIIRQRIMLLLAQGDIRAARQYAAQLQAPSNSPVALLQALTRARICLAEGQPAAALEKLRPARLSADATEMLTLRIELRVAEAIARRASGQPEAAVALLTQALEYAEAGGFVRVFIAEGAPMFELLRRIAASQTQMSAYARRLLGNFATSEYLTRIDLPEALTPREQAILGLLHTGLRNREVATKLVIAESTLKRHVSNIYLKLGVHNRTHALARARELGLLTRES